VEEVRERKEDVERERSKKRAEARAFKLRARGWCCVEVKEGDANADPMSVG